MKAAILLLTCMSVLSLFSCKSTYTPEAYTKAQIRFGNGGGFTGAVTEYSLLASGHVFLKNDQDTAFQKITKISKSEAKLLFEQALEHEIPTYEMNHPYNMYKFITYMEADQKNHLVWGMTDNEKVCPEEIRDFYDKLIVLTSITE